MTTRARRTAVLVLLAVFLAGAAGGWLLDEVGDDMDWPGFFDDRDRRPTDPDGDPLDDDAEEAFLESLGLSRGQLETVDRLLDEREDRLESYWRTQLPEIQALVDSTRVRIRALLTPDQRAAYDRWIERHQSGANNR